MVPRPPRFPDPRTTGPEGLVALGGGLTPDWLESAYREGIFPWPVAEADAMTWFCPPRRAILDFSELHVPRSLRAAANKKIFEFTFDQAFSDVIAACADAYRPGQPGTWITDDLEQAYLAFHRAGFAHSVEAWVRMPSGERELAGGLYGVFIDGAFAGESMFYRAPNASKLALLHLVEKLRAVGIGWMDIQMLTPHMERLGARELSRDDFLNRLSLTHRTWRARSDPPPRLPWPVSG
jgi:leucyl/phenylalanyl-tRNA--protein transferase